MFDIRQHGNVAMAAAIVALLLLKLAFVSDLSPYVILAPHDDNLYVVRALYLLRGDGFGPYTSTVLAKLPGMSLWLAALRALGLPYLPLLQLLYIAAGLYMLAALRRCGVSRWLLVVTFALYLFNPVTMGAEWIRVIREPLATVLLVAIVAALLHIHIAMREGKPFVRHLLFFSVLFGFAMLVREEDRLLWGLLSLFAAALWLGRRGAPAGRHGFAWRLAAIVLVPAAAALAANVSARYTMERWYGLPILHDYGEGEYPKLLAAIRGIVSEKDNRLVMVTQEALAELRVEVPEFAPVIALLPPPGPATVSCKLQRVCSEWSNGWMPFWIKDSAAQAGLTPTLPAAQAYFRRVREKIEVACQSGRLRCRERGAWLVPPFELRWTRAYVHEFSHLLGLALAPVPNIIAVPVARFNVSPGLGRIYQAVTMSDYFDSLRESNFADQDERLYVNPLREWRVGMVVPFQLIAALLLVLSLLALFYRWTVADTVAPDAVLWFATVFYAFTALRFCALAYLATFFGPFDSRIIFSAYIAALIFAPVLIAEAARAWRARRRGADASANR